MTTGFKVQDLKNDSSQKKLDEAGGKNAFNKALRDATTVAQLKAVIKDGFKALGLLGKED